ncbi:class I poly(R)-hydroxyalkanoic acid synthase [Comamonas piscis]|uniref:Class I poly(R)-hydroxyalkanoic acid synthase n=1 Tax=Comamonas piscis TaxID=1562974 RepID=A0A7G5EIQ4_9BURK|nr:class I poly(R)-hydroxyalkanoic acid synthase [Comamonas piscis]QMV73879.1 class I poly(R)-hydroxyalkanoic acid synthase [Comamonas piscis]WSO32303.1 class I poly(R)-hydroxyalkanoic acid synthase [Comamonas piscis]
MTQQPYWGLGSDQIQQLSQMTQQWMERMQSLQTMAAPFNAMGAPTSLMAGVGQAPAATPPVSFDMDKLQAVQAQYAQAALALWTEGAKGEVALPKDRRFAGEAWQQNPVSSFTAASYALHAKTMMAMVDAVQGDEKTRARVRFGVEQWLAATAPSNFLAFNAEAQKKAIDTQGQSIAQGLQNMLADMRQGHVSMTDESLFEVGKNVATSEGAVVFQNELFQLIEYKPLTTQVYERPMLFVPPCINKYYILDLQPDNSLIRHSVAQGHRTFVVSWRNPDASLGNKGWDDYIGGAVLEAIEVVKAISGKPQINALGFCVGGTMLVNALAVLAARGDESVASATLLTTLVDFADTGILDVFIDENFVKFREMTMGQNGLMPGPELASTFSFLRPVDLVWNYVVGNYLKGETPPPFDLLYWNSDSTNLPGPYYAWYLRNFYLENKLVQPSALTVCGEKIDVGQIDMPIYIYGSREDHIVPIGAAYASTQVLGGDKRFVMGASGHIAGVINPPAKNKRSHWLREDGDLPADIDAWIAGADELPGSWWTDWSQWLTQHAGKKVAAPKSYGRARTEYQALEPAPGSYVQAKA